MMNEIDSDKITAFKVARRAAWQPLLGAALGVAVVVALTVLISSGEMNVVATTLIVTLCLIPLLILLLPVFIGVMLGIWGLARADKAAVQRLIQAERAAADAKARAQDGSMSVGKRFIGIAAAVERLEPLWRIFDPNDQTKGRSDAAKPAKPEQPAGS